MRLEEAKKVRLHLDLAIESDRPVPYSNLVPQ